MLHVSPPSPAVDAVPASPDSARALVEQQLAVLARLTGMGMQIAEAATARAVAGLQGEAVEGEAKDLGRRDPTLAYTRAARAVRMCIALQTRLLGELPTLERAEDDIRIEQRTRRKKQIVHLVKTVAETGDADEIEQIDDEAWERLSDADEYSAVMNCPLREAVARICEDLDVTPDWTAWPDEAWVQAPPPTPLGGGGGGPRSGGGGFGALSPAVAPQSHHPGLRPYFPHREGASGEEQDVSGEELSGSG